MDRMNRIKALGWEDIEDFFHLPLLHPSIQVFILPILSILLIVFSLELSGRSQILSPRKSPANSFPAPLDAQKSPHMVQVASSSGVRLARIARASPG